MKYDMLNYFIYLENQQSIHKVRSKLKDISRILKDIGALLGKDNNSLDVRISHPGNATEASFEIERMKNKISVNVVQPNNILPSRTKLGIRGYYRLLWFADQHLS